MYGAYCWKFLDNNLIIKMHGINNNVKLVSRGFTQENLNTVSYVCIWDVVHKTVQAMIHTAVTVMDFCDSWYSWSLYYTFTARFKKCYPNFDTTQCFF
jgi:hypothetical protein